VPRERFWDLIDRAEALLLITAGAEGFPRVRPMILVLREGATLWFVTSAASRKVGEIRANPCVTVVALDRGGLSHASLSGRAEVVAEQETRARLWHEVWREEWPAGASDPDYLVVRVVAERGAFSFSDTNEAGEFSLPG
jgi:general stress protein 26